VPITVSELLEGFAVRGHRSGGQRGTPVALSVFVVGLLVAACGSTNPSNVPSSTSTPAPVATIASASPTASPENIFPPPSLDPDAPAFPVPAGATLVNAQLIGGSGPGAARIAAWTSPFAYEATVAFYASLADPRWVRSGSLATTPSMTAISFTDASGVLAGVELGVARTDPVRIGAVFRSATAATPGPSTTPGPTIAFATLPPATALPAGFPAQLVPANSSLVDAAELARTYDAIFTSSDTPTALAAAYQAALPGFATGVVVHTEGSATLIDFSTPGGPGQIVLVPDGAGSTTVSIEVRP
jgi:hypothetical protein